MRASTAYFAGVGTVIVAVSAGLGGGYLAANITSPPSQTISKLERRMSAEPIAVSTAPAEPVPYVAATNTASKPAQEQPQTTQPQPQTQPQQRTEAAASSANAAPSANADNARAEEKTANDVAVAQLVQPPQPAKSAEQTDEKTAAPRDALAKTRDADVKRAAAEQRRAERRQRWADKRRFQQPREQELEAVEGSVREVTEPRRIRIREEGEPREMFAEPARGEMPRIRLFDQDD
jgi:type IV secretory pathway VirB10-like protein